jgi:hypothetical protein
MTTATADPSIDLSSFNGEIAHLGIDDPTQKAVFACLRGYGFSPINAATALLLHIRRTGEFYQLETRRAELLEIEAAFNRVLDEGARVLIQEAQLDTVSLAGLHPILK